MSYSFIIVAYNSSNTIQGCIDSIIEFCDRYTIEVVVVDNSKCKDTEKIVLSFNKAVAIKYYRNKSNVGYGSGNNFGVERAKYNNVFIMNPDVRLIMPLVQHLENALHENVGILGFKQISKTNISFFFRPEYSIPLLRTPLNLLLNKFDLYLENFMCFSGSFFLVSKKAFIEAGMFDEKIFLYGEEADLHKRIKKFGFNSTYFPDIKYIHLDFDRKAPSLETIDVQLRSVMYYFRKHNLNGYFYLFTYFLNSKLKYFYCKFLSRNITRSELFSERVKLFRKYLSQL